ncbi:MAG: GntR family transcriptional regulator [Lysobacterales bacterium]
MQYTVLPRQAVSSQAATAIRSMILDGVIPDGERINEVHLSQQLGVSRTPIREGLGQLVADQFVNFIPRRGFFVRELSVAEFSDLYDMRPMLDPQALLIGGQPTEREIILIDEANDQFLNAQSNVESVSTDETFHRCLIKRCPNQVLLELIDHLMVRTKRYELALFRESEPVQTAQNEHANIIKALRDQNLEQAAEHLRQNLTSGKAPIVAWLSAR